MGYAAKAFPDPLKPRTLILISRNSPFYTQKFEPELRERDDVAVRDTIAGYEELGYAALDTGTLYAIEDYGDRTHLTSAGGAKLAAVVAPKIEALATKLRYVK